MNRLSDHLANIIRGGLVQQNGFVRPISGNVYMGSANDVNPDALAHRLTDYVREHFIDHAYELGLYKVAQPEYPPLRDAGVLVAPAGPMGTQWRTRWVRDD